MSNYKRYSVMKKVILSFVAAVFAVSSFAHDSAKMKKTPEEIASKRSQKFQSELGLSDDQKSKVYVLILDKENKTNAIKKKYNKNDSISKSQRHTEMKAVKVDFETKLTALLTAEQKVKYDAMKEKEKSKRKHKGKDKHPSKGKGQGKG